MKRCRAIFAIAMMVISLLTSACGESREIRILHVNDLHGFAEPFRPYHAEELVGGIAFMAARIEALRHEKPAVLLAAGDMLLGNDWANLFEGESMMAAMNAMGFDAMVVGNHEFDLGPEVLAKRISEATFPVLGANVEGLGTLAPYVLRDIAGVKVAIIGVTTEHTPLVTHPKNVVGLAFVAPDKTVRTILKEIVHKADLVVVLSHLGFPADRALAEAVPGIDIIVGGHTHTRISTPVVVGNTFIVQAWEYGRALGVVDLVVRDGKVATVRGRLEEIRPSAGKEEPAVAEVVRRYTEKMDSSLNEVIGETRVPLDGEQVRQQETNLGDLVADSMRESAKAEVAITNGGGIRGSIAEGTITKRDVYRVLPFDNYIIALRLSGTQIREVLEHGVSGREPGEGRFPQVSGLKFSYRPSAPPGERITEILVGGTPIEPDREYMVATNDFLVAGGDGYGTFGEALSVSGQGTAVGQGMLQGGRVVYNNAGRWVRDVVVDSLREKGRVAPVAGSRIVALE